jgi:hypothetical protein
MKPASLGYLSVAALPCPLNRTQYVGLKLHDAPIMYHSENPWPLKGYIKTTACFLEGKEEELGNCSMFRGCFIKVRCGRN